MGSLQLEETDSHTSNHKDHSVKSVTTTAPFNTYLSLHSFVFVLGCVLLHASWVCDLSLPAVSA